jgi:hypothetical protein
MGALGHVFLGFQADSSAVHHLLAQAHIRSTRGATTAAPDITKANRFFDMKWRSVFYEPRAALNECLKRHCIAVPSRIWQFAMCSIRFIACDHSMRHTASHGGSASAAKDIHGSGNYAGY